MIRICHLITGLYAHGAERMLLKLLSGLDAGQFESTVISLMDKGSVGAGIEALGIPVLTVNLPRGRPHPAGVWWLIRQVRSARPDLLQGWMYHGNLAASLAARFTPRPAPVFWNIRQSLYGLEQEKRLTRWLIRLSARWSRSARHVIYNSLTSAEQHERLGFAPERRVFIPNGFDVNTFTPDPAAGLRLRKSLGLPENSLLIGMAARDHPMKDHATLLNAAARLAPRHPAARWLLAGAGMVAENQPLTAMIDSLSLAGRVLLLGEQQDMPRFFQGLDIAVLSSAWGEGFPNVLGEAMACGVPCVATAVGDAPAILGETGLIVPPREPAALAGALESWLAGGETERRWLGRKARERIVSHYALSTIAGQYATLYAKAT